MENKGPEKEKCNSLIALLPIVFGILLNFLFAKLAALAGMPIYLDNIGTIEASVFGGYLPGIFVGYLNNLNIATGDEIENLYESLSKTISETVGYLEDVKEKGEEISHMQSGLIYVLADLVESRD